MLQQTQVKTVIPYWERWMRDLPTVPALAKAKPERVLKLWEGLGYYSRARNLQKAAQLIMREHDGKFPTPFDAVLALPGIGRYTAGAITSIARNQPSPILDGNVIRVLARLFGIAEDPREKATNARLWSLATQFVETAGSPSNANFRFQNPNLLLAGSCSALNQSLMELGALVCTPRQPRCEGCPVRRNCVARTTNRVESLPNVAKRAAATSRRFVAFVVQHNGRWLVRQRPARVVNAHLWEFPNAEVDGTTTNLQVTASTLLRAQPGSLKPLITVKHSITRYRISLEAHLTTGAQPAHRKNGDRWLSLRELEKLPFTSAHRKVLMALKQETATVGGGDRVGSTAAPAVVRRALAPNPSAHHDTPAARRFP
jgi:A/G-specific adenine glycosylase